MIYEILPNGKWKFRFDNHIISTFTTCERLYELKHIRNQSKKGGIGFNLAVGIWWSEVMSDLYEGIAANQAAGRNEPPSLVSVLMSAVQHWIKYDMDKYKTLAPDKYKRFGGTGTFSFDNRIEAGRETGPIEFPVGAMEMVSQYYEHRANADARHWKIIATETSFGVLDELVIGEDSKVVVAYQGRPDIIALDFGNRLMPLDHKTKDYPDLASAIFEYKPHPQTAGYVYCLNRLVESLQIKNRTVDRCVLIISGRFPPAEPRKKDNPKKPRFIEVPVQYSQAELNEWRDQVIGKAHRMRDAVERNQFQMKESSCHFQFGSACEFRPVCSQPPGARELILRRDYETIRPWSAAMPEERNKQS